MRPQRLFATWQCSPLYYLPTPAGFRLTHSASHPTRLSTQTRTNRYRPFSTSSPVLHLLSPSQGVIMARTGGPSSSSNNTRINRPHQQNAAQRARTYSQTQSRRSSVYRTSLHGSSTSATLQFSWLLRSNISPRRGMSLPGEVQKRHIFGIGEIIGVLANVRTHRSLWPPDNSARVLILILPMGSPQRRFAP